MFENVAIEDYQKIKNTFNNLYFIVELRNHILVIILTV